MTIDVRKAVDSDLATLVAFNQAMCVETEGRRLDASRLESGIAKALGDPARGVYSVAQSDGRPVGCLMLTREWSDWRDGWMWWIQSVFVAPEARGKGVYRALHGDVLARAAAAGDVRAVRLYVERENTGAQAVYDACGMSQSRYLLYEQGVGSSSDD